MEPDFFIDRLHVFVYPDRQVLGAQAALMAETAIVEMLQNKPEINIIFAAAPSQNEFLSNLAQSEKIDWNRINAYHMDEYIGLADDAPQKFSTYLKEHLFDRVPLKTINLINSSNPSPEDECMRYTCLLKSNPPDIVCMGIGENGHIAFNDPPVANFRDPMVVKIVTLDDICRQQQVNDGCFASLDQVPAKAISLTIPALMYATKIFCVVPGTTKAKAVYNTLNMEIGEKCPATTLRRHKKAKLFLDVDSSSLLR